MTQASSLASSLVVHTSIKSIKRETKQINTSNLTYIYQSRAIDASRGGEVGEELSRIIARRREPQRVPTMTGAKSSIELEPRESKRKDKVSEDINRSGVIETIERL